MRRCEPRAFAANLATFPLAGHDVPFALSRQWRTSCQAGLVVGQWGRAADSGTCARGMGAMSPFRHQFWRVSGPVVVLTLASAVEAHAQGFVITTLDSNYPASINDASQVLAAPLPYGAGWNILDLASGQTTHLDNVPSSPRAFNKTKIVGTYLSGTSFNSFKPFIYDIQTRTYAAVDTPTSIVNPQAYALNNSTQIVGTYTSDHVATFLWSGGTWTTLNPPASCSFSPTGDQRPRRYRRRLPGHRHPRSIPLQ